MQRSWFRFYQNFVFGLNKKWKIFGYISYYYITSGTVLTKLQSCSQISGMGVDRYKMYGGQKADFHLTEVRKIVLKIAKNSFTGVIIDKGMCNVSAVKFHR